MQLVNSWRELHFSSLTPPDRSAWQKHHSLLAVAHSLPCFTLARRWGGNVSSHSTVHFLDLLLTPRRMIGSVLCWGRKSLSHWPSHVWGTTWLSSLFLKPLSYLSRGQCSKLPLLSWPAQSIEDTLLQLPHSWLLFDFIDWFLDVFQLLVNGFPNWWLQCKYSDPSRACTGRMNSSWSRRSVNSWCINFPTNGDIFWRRGILCIQLEPRRGLLWVNVRLLGRSNEVRSLLTSAPRLS